MENEDLKTQAKMYWLRLASLKLWTLKSLCHHQFSPRHSHLLSLILQGAAVITEGEDA